MPNNLQIMFGEMTENYIQPHQPPKFNLVGFTPIASISRLPQTSHVHNVQEYADEKDNRDGLAQLLMALLKTQHVAVLQHSSGEECFLRPLR